MNSLKELVEKHGFHIFVKSVNRSFPPFKIIYEVEDCYVVEYSHGHTGFVLKEYPTTNDYVLLENGW